ncbi:alpha/beta hydrolase [Hymenobacter sp. BT683]|uniref:Alpha/beta hydrolase n=1 Tax=Hymenobacter jeongseonensis TaxID=2791027 RepID=A0ABS0IK29_9BACT|nr:alpha/beta hydrolase [Hymenobacter jeongseonensis]MBF9238384.1 alpha/beta hydrolase [Hymenobacter jeongseonensis]
MNYTVLRRPFAALLLGLALAQPAFANTPPAAGAATIVADNPAAHPSFTVRVVGKGRPVILIPGLTCPGAVWDETVARYQSRYQCHVVSLAGFGGVPAATGNATSFLPAVRDQLLAYIKTQKLDRPAIVGHSLGGFMGLWLSVAQPEAIGPLVILDSLPFLAAIQNPNMTAEAARPMAEGMRKQASAGKMPMAQQRQMVTSMVTDTARQRLVAVWGQASDPASVAQAMYEMYTTDLRADLGAVRQPALVLGTWAAYQPYGATLASTRAIFAAQYAKLPQHKIEMSQAGKHFIMYDDAAWFFEQTDAFLQANYAGKASYAGKK